MIIPSSNKIIIRLDRVAAAKKKTQDNGRETELGQGKRLESDVFVFCYGNCSA